ncbi:MAG: DUF951 domain-containing protein [Christensenellaceae bacterium]|nr:DUF951 domain-containing protein [Christensenellaceae bacterium]
MELGFALGDTVETKKPHPCGSRLWQIIRTGADIKIKCSGCGRIVMLPYADFLRRVRRVIPHEQ